MNRDQREDAFIDALLQKFRKKHEQRIIREIGLGLLSGMPRQSYCLGIPEHILRNGRTNYSGRKTGEEG